MKPVRGCTAMSVALPAKRSPDVVGQAVAQPEDDLARPRPLADDRPGGGEQDLVQAVAAEGTFWLSRLTGGAG